MPRNDFQRSAPSSVGHPEQVKDYHGLVARGSPSLIARNLDEPRPVDGDAGEIEAAW